MKYFPWKILIEDHLALARNGSRACWNDFLMARDSKHTSFQRNDTEDVEIELASEAGPVDGRPRYSLGGHYTQVGRA